VEDVLPVADSETIFRTADAVRRSFVAIRL
jgi:hypothetical protein